jgi:hypothetical protein
LLKQIAENRLQKTGYNKNCRNSKKQANSLLEKAFCRNMIIPEIYNNIKQKISNEIITDTGNSLKSLSFTTDM